MTHDKHTHVARKSHGKCASCKKAILKGQTYRSLLRHATEAEKANPRVRTMSVIPGKGPMISVKVHADCPVPPPFK